MNRARYWGISSAVIVALAAAGCGSAAQPGGGSSTGTTSPSKRLELASAGRAATQSAENAAPAIFPVRPTVYVLDATLPDLGARALVRSMDAPDVDSADVQRFASALGLEGSPVRNRAGWEMQGTDASLSVIVADGRVGVSYSSGVPNVVGGSAGSGGGATSGSASSDGSVTKGAPPVPSPAPTTATVVPQPPPPVDVPSADEARTMARALLDRLGVLAGQEWATDVNDSGGVAVACPVGVPCPTVPPQISARTVTFSLMLDATRVDGVDWSVTIGEHRRIESLSGEWASPAPRGSYPLRSTAAVFADLQHGKARYSGPQPMTALSDSIATGAPATGAPAIETPPTVPAVTVHVTGVSLGIARWDAYERGHTVVDLVPTYRFHTRVDGSASNDIVVLALEPSAVTFTNSVPKPEPLPAKPAPAPIPVPGGAESTPTS
jgi:hypothetical protein